MDEKLVLSEEVSPSSGLRGSNKEGTLQELPLENGVITEHTRFRRQEQELAEEFYSVPVSFYTWVIR